MAAKATNMRVLAVACGVAAAIISIALAVMLVNNSKGETASAKSDDSAYSVTFDGSDVYGDSVAGAPQGTAQSKANGGAKTKDVALIRDPEEKYASPEKKGAAPHKVAEMPAASSTTAPAAGAQSTADVKKALKDEKAAGKAAPGDSVTLDSDGSALAPLNAPPVINAVIAAANNIKNYPYIWGGGHGSFQDNGYDCSGSVSYALAGGNLLNAPLTSGELANWGEPGPGKWITIYANGGHVFMFVGGLRYDTSFRDGPRGTRWQNGKRSLAGFEIRHPAGL
jgi:cell wall-associated NlpC family hydrolase